MEVYKNLIDAMKGGENCDLNDEDIELLKKIESL